MMKISDPARPQRVDLGSHVGDISRVGHYDRPAREGRGNDLFGDPDASPDDLDPKTGRAKPNSTRAARSIDCLDDRQYAAGDPAKRSVARPGAPGYGRRMPHSTDEDKIAEATRDTSERD